MSKNHRFKRGENVKQEATEVILKMVEEIKKRSASFLSEAQAEGDLNVLDEESLIQLGTKANTFLYHVNQSFDRLFGQARRIHVKDVIRICPDTSFLSKSEDVKSLRVRFEQGSSINELRTLIENSITEAKFFAES